MPVKKQIAGSYWSLGFIFLLLLLGQVSDFVNFFVIPKILRSFLRLQRGNFWYGIQK